MTCSVIILVLDLAFTTFPDRVTKIYAQLFLQPIIHVFKVHQRKTVISSVAGSDLYLLFARHLYLIVCHSYVTIEINANQKLLWLIKKTVTSYNNGSSWLMVSTIRYSESIQNWTTMWSPCTKYENLTFAAFLKMNSISDVFSESCKTFWTTISREALLLKFFAGDHCFY